MTYTAVGTVKIVDVKERENGDVTIVVDMDMDTLVMFAELGLKVSLLAAAETILTEDEGNGRT